MYLEEYTPQHKEVVNNYYLTEEMNYYTSHPKDCLLKSAENKSFHSILAFSDQALVTFLVLDEGKDNMLYTDNKNTMLLRSFSTDSRFLKKGHAKEALRILPKFIQQNYPHIEEIVLAVNMKNTSAQNLYLKTGFIDKGTRVQGPIGELMVMTKLI